MVTISSDLVSVVTDSAIDEVRAWQSWAPEPTYAIVFFDALRVKIRDESLFRNKAIYLAIGMRCSDHKEVLGLWIEQTEGAKFWLRVMSEFENSAWGESFPTVAQSWRHHWPQIIPFFAFAAPVRKMAYTTDAIERKSIRNKGHFPSDEAATKLIWLALRNITAKWKNPPIAWAAAKAQFAIQFGERFTLDD